MANSDLQLLLVVVVELFRNSNRLLLHVDVISSEHKLPVRIDRVGDRGNGLQREGQVRDLAVILRDINLPLVDAFPEAVQQLLLESNVDRGLYGRIEEKRRRRRRTR